MPGVVHAGVGLVEAAGQTFGGSLDLVDENRGTGVTAEIRTASLFCHVVNRTSPLSSSSYVSGVMRIDPSRLRVRALPQERFEIVVSQWSTFIGCSFVAL